MFSINVALMVAICSHAASAAGSESKSFSLAGSFERIPPTHLESIITLYHGDIWVVLYRYVGGGLRSVDPVLECQWRCF